MDKNKDFRSGYAAIIGKPNVGKSTLLNSLLQQKLSIVTRKPQTTRRKILGILNSETFQIIFIDTPGIIEAQYKLQKIMMQYLKHAIENADLLVYIVDAADKHRESGLLTIDAVPENFPVILVLNKIDLIEKNKLLQLISHYRNIYNFNAIIPVSGLKGDGLDILLHEITNCLPIHPPYFSPDYVSDQQERFFVSEIIREKIFHFYGDEIPYACHVEVEKFVEQSGKKDYIVAVIHVDKISQKGIIIGKHGKAIKKIGQLARQDIEHFLDRPIYLELYVKANENWRKKPGKLKEMGY